MKDQSHFLATLIKPILLAVQAIVLLIFMDSAACFAMAVTIASAVGVFDLYRLVIRPHAVRFSSTLAISVLLGYGLGSAIYLLANWTIYAAKYQYFSIHGVTFSQQGLSMALAASLFAAAVLYIRALFEGSVYSKNWTDSLDRSTSIRLLWFGVAVTALALYLGDFGYMGAYVSNTYHVSPLGVIANIIVPPLFPFAILLLTGKQPLSKKIVYIVILLFLLGTLFILHRRYLLYALVLAAIAWHMRMHGFSLRKRAGSLTLTIFAIFILYWGFEFFQALRLAEDTFGKEMNLFELAQVALTQLVGAKAEVIHELLSKNVGSRPFILAYLGGLMQLKSAQMPTWGAELVYSLQMSIPSILMPGKVGALPPSTESLIHPLYGIPIFDGPNSFLTAGFDDFGFIGAVFYPLAVTLLYSWYYKLIRAFIHEPAIRIFVLFALLFQLLFIEQGLSEVFVTMRDLLIIVIIASITSRLPVLRLVKVKPYIRHGDQGKTVSSTVPKT